jgi:uncharacterized protein (DUF2336 family)
MRPLAPEWLEMLHKAVAPTNSIETKNPARSADGVPATTPQFLIDELEGALANKDLRHRAAVMRRVTDLFLVKGVGFSEEHIAVFDDVMSRLVLAIDSSARAEFGDLIANHPNAPTKTSRILALDDEIEVARPILMQSEKLDEATLVEGARTKSQDHLYAISLRDSISEAVTDVLVQRGNNGVVVSTAANPGARFSEFGCSTLATRSRDDNELALRVWLRSDIPRQYLLTLFSTASDGLKEQLSVANRQKAQLYRSLVDQAEHQLRTQMREGSATYEIARAYVECLYCSGDLTEVRLLSFAQDGKFDEVTVALSLMSGLPVGDVERAVVHSQTDHFLVLAKAVDLSWETTKAILSTRAPIKNYAGKDIESRRASFMKLQKKTAISAMQFYRLRARAEAQLEEN